MREREREREREKTENRDLENSIGSKSTKVKRIAKLPFIQSHFKQVKGIAVEYEKRSVIFLQSFGWIMIHNTVNPLCTNRGFV